MIHYKQNKCFGFAMLFKIWGSVLPWAIPNSVVAGFLTWAFLYWEVVDGNVSGGTLMYHPSPFTFFFQIAAFMLAFHTNTAYGRYWEARTQLQIMAAYWADFASETMTFDEVVDYAPVKEPPPKPTQHHSVCGREGGDGVEKRPGGANTLAAPSLGPLREADPTEKKRVEFSPLDGLMYASGPREATVIFRARLVHLVSLLHAVCMQYLLSGDAKGVCLEVLGGVEYNELQVLSQADDQPFLVSHWLSQLLSYRTTHGGLPIAPPILSRVWQLLSLANLAYNQACKIEDTPFPFPYVQLIYVIDFSLVFVTPVVTACWTQDVILAVFLTMLAVGGFHAMFIAAGMMEAPFGTRPNDLPMLDLHKDFVNRLKCIIDVFVIDKLNEMIAASNQAHFTYVSTPENQRSTFDKLTKRFPFKSPGDIEETEATFTPRNMEMGTCQAYTLTNSAGKKQTFHGFELTSPVRSDSSISNPPPGANLPSIAEGHVSLVSCDEALPIGSRRIGVGEDSAANKKRPFNRVQGP